MKRIKTVFLGLAAVTLAVLLYGASSSAGEPAISEMLEMEENGVRVLITPENYEKFYKDDPNVRLVSPPAKKETAAPETDAAKPEEKDADTEGEKGADEPAKPEDSEKKAEAEAPAKGEVSFAATVIRTKGYLPKAPAYYVAGNQIVTPARMQEMVKQGEIGQDEAKEMHRLAPTIFVDEEALAKAVASAREADSALSEEQAKTAVMNDTKKAEAKRLESLNGTGWKSRTWDEVGVLAAPLPADDAQGGIDGLTLIEAAGLDAGVVHYLLDGTRIVTDENKYLSHALLTGEVKDEQAQYLLPLGKDRFAAEDRFNGAVREVSKRNPDMTYEMVKLVIVSRLEGKPTAQVKAQVKAAE